MRYCLIAILVFTFVALVNTQTPDRSVNVSVGKHSVKLPTPAGYINAWEGYPSLRAAFEINEADNNQMLAMYAPLSSVPGLDTGRYLGFPRYARVSVSKALASVNVSEAQFRTFVEMFEKGAKDVYKVDGPFIPKSVSEIKRDLRKHFGSDGSFQVKESTYLGPIGRTKFSFACAGIMSIEAVGKNIPVYNVSAVLHLRSRILFFYFYGNITAEGDIDSFKSEATKMIDEIVAANRIAQKRSTRAK